MNKKEIVWKDSFKKRFLLTIVVLLITFVWIYALFISTEILSKIVLIIIVVSLLYLVYRGIKMQRHYVTRRGIFVYDNAMQKGFFLMWGEILTILMKREYFSGGNLFVWTNRIIIKTKDKKKYTGTIFNFKGLIQVLKKLNRHSLLDENSSAFFHIKSI